MADKDTAAMRELCQKDLFFLMYIACKRIDIDKDWLFERCRELEREPNGYLDLWSREHFKDLSDDTPMLTVNRGWTTHGELEVGDFVFSPDGKPVMVIALSPKYTTSKCYKIVFDCGETIKAGAGHLWDIRKKHKNRINGTDKRKVCFSKETLSTEQLFYKGGRIDVGVCEPLNYNFSKLLIDPYTLGVWLGDGTSSANTITTAYSDIEIINEIKNRGYSVSERKSSNKNTGLFAINTDIVQKKKGTFVGKLRQLNVFKNKHIPKEYLESSEKQRFDLLKGLMDTDGTCNTRGTATFCNQNDELAYGVYQLALSLGLRPRIGQYKSELSKDGYFWQIRFQAHKNKNPFLLKRKADRAINNSHYDGVRTIRSIERIDSVPTRCIQVDGGRYVCGRGLIPTHNSSLITFGKTIQDILNDPNITCGIFSHTRPIAKGFLAQIKREFEDNDFLKCLFPDVLYDNPAKDSPSWSADNGIIVKRTQNPKEATIEAWGLVDGQPTGKHFSHLIYDDVVTLSSVTTPEQIQKTTDAFAMSLNLGKEGGVRRGIGTRYHLADTYKEIMARGTLKARIYPATKDGTVDGDPVLWTKEVFRAKFNDMGSYVASCHCAKTKILMADWSYKNIEDVREGDFVVGFEIGKIGKRFKLVKTKVVATRKRVSKANRYILDSGSIVECTPDHNWWTGRCGNDHHRVWSSLGEQKGKELRGLERVSWINELKDEDKKLAAAYLAGILDGEGTISRSHKDRGLAGGGRIIITQSHEHNPDVCKRIEECLNELEIPFVVYKRDAFSKHGKHSKASSMYSLCGGRPERHRILQICNVAKKKALIESLYGGAGRFKPSKKEMVISFEDMGDQEVFNIQTETGNYIANGFASKNCQLLQNPLADNAMGFKEDWLMWYNQLHGNPKMNIYILVDPASKKKKNSDYTTMGVIGLCDDGNYYLLDGVRDRMNLTERTNTLFRLVREWEPLSVGYEEYGLQADIEHIQYVQEQEGYRFPIDAIGGSMSKFDRIQRLVPVFEQRRFYFPRTIRYVGYDGMAKDFIQQLLVDEYRSFPVCQHDDMLDMLARVFDIGAVFPKKMTHIPRDIFAKEKEYHPLD